MALKDEDVDFMLETIARMMVLQVAKPGPLEVGENWRDWQIDESAFELLRVTTKLAAGLCDHNPTGFALAAGILAINLAASEGLPDSDIMELRLKNEQERLARWFDEKRGNGR